jgi:hypothetical protein
MDSTDLSPSRQGDKLGWTNQGQMVVACKEKTAIELGDTPP